MKIQNTLLAHVGCVSLAALALLATAPALAQAPDAAWRRVALDATVSVEFPGVPKPNQQGGETGLQFISPDGEALYSAFPGPTELAADAPDSARLALYEKRLNGSGNPDQLTARRPVRVADELGLEYQLTVDTGAGVATTFNRLVVLGGKLYIFSASSRTPDKPTVAADRERFFGAIRAGAGSADGASAAPAAEAAAPTAAAPANPDAAPASRSPFSPATVVAGLLGGLGALWLIRRRSQANKPNA